MSPLLPVALYGLEVPPGDIMIPAAVDFPATVSISAPQWLEFRIEDFVCAVGVA